MFEWDTLCEHTTSKHVIKTTTATQGDEEANNLDEPGLPAETRLSACGFSSAHQLSRALSHVYICLLRGGTRLQALPLLPLP